MGNWVKIPCIRWFEINLFCVFSELINLFCVFSDSGARCEPRCILQVYSPQSIHLPGHPQLHMDCQALWLWPAMCRRQVGSKWLKLTELITVVEWNIIYLLNWHNPRNYTELEVISMWYVFLAGKRISSAHCYRGDGEEVSPRYCDLRSRPQTGVSACNIHHCAPRWGF